MELGLNHMFQDGHFTQAVIHGTRVEVAAQGGGNLVHDDKVHVGHHPPRHSRYITLVVPPHHFKFEAASIETE